MEKKVYTFPSVEITCLNTRYLMFSEDFSTGASNPGGAPARRPGKPDEAPVF
ncbi:MAG: hypothetical protein IJQ20_02230 [Paludibacteraceae bacterium]|nr:hypothetical protein [Paludibacteraceae bacterium]MBQ6983724.1 hypothetical protein [Paludibacteraceae bacterium]